jgi:serine/threonine-protein kinase
MASRADLELARRLLQGAVLTEAQIREALELQGELLQKGKVVSLERVLVAKGHLPKDVLEVLDAKDPLAEQPFPGYRVDRVLGEGGSSVVYGGVYLANRTPVAVKVLNAVGALKPEHRDRFYEEARLLIEIDHENVVAGYEVGYAHGHHYFTMDLVEGPTLLEMIERGGAIPNPTAISITMQIANAVGFLHSQGLLHRDIKPGNVMIDATGRARLIDLGLVRRMKAPAPGAAPAPAAEEATTVGTVEYISPEQARGRGDLDVRSDIYSLGVTLYHMVVGDVPFHGETNYEVMAKQILSALETQKVKTRRIAPEIHYFVTKMMSKEREHRYASAEEVVEELSRFLPPGGPPPIVLPVAPPPAAKPVVPPARPPVRPATPVRPVPAARPPAAAPAKPVVPPVAKAAPPPPAKPIVPPVAKPAPVAPAKAVVPPVAVPPPAKPVAPPAAAPPPPPAPVAAPERAAAEPPPPPPPESPPAPAPPRPPGTPPAPLVTKKRRRW